MAFRCEQCQRDFATADALAQHNRDKHAVKEKKQVQQPSETKIKKKMPVKKYAVIVIGLVVVLVLGFVFLGSVPRVVSYTPILGIDNIVTYKGSSDAPVLIEEFSDYQCPFCGSFARETAPLLEDEYVNTGKVRIVFKDFPLPSHTNAPKASEAALCSGDQGKYWEMHDVLFRNQNTLSVNNLKNYAAEIGLNTSLFNDCLDSGIMGIKVRENMAEGQRRGVQGTPYFFINGQVINGAQPLAQFRLVINSALAAVNQSG